MPEKEPSETRTLAFEKIRGVIKKVIPPSEKLFRRGCYNALRPIRLIKWSANFDEDDWTLTAVPIVGECIDRFKDFLEKHPELQTQAYQDLKDRFVLSLLVMLFSGMGLPDEKKYVVAKELKKLTQDVRIVFSDGNDNQLKRIIQVLKEKEQEYRDISDTQTIGELLSWDEKGVHDQDSLLIPSKSKELERILKNEKLIHFNSTLSPLFSLSRPRKNVYVNWLGSQQGFIYLFLTLFQEQFHDRSIYRFASERILIKAKPVKPKQLCNSYNNLKKKLRKKAKNHPPAEITLIDGIIRNIGLS